MKKPPEAKLTPAPARTPSPADVVLSAHRLSVGRLTPRRVYTLPLEKLRPVIRIAHRRSGVLNIPGRLILDHELVLVLAGRGQLRFPGDAVPFGGGSLLFIPPFVRHEFLSDPGEARHIAVHFDLAAHFPAFASNLHRRPPYEVRFAHGLALPRNVTLRAGDPIVRWLAEIVTHFSRGEPVARLRAETLLLNVLAALLDARSSARTPPTSKAAFHHAARARIDRALAYLERHLAERLAPADLARAAGLSPSHFTRLFRRWTGWPPGEYVVRRRVELARGLLGDVDLSIKEVASRSGFDDPYYFSKVFRRIDGLPPTLFRAELLAGKRGG